MSEPKNTEPQAEDESPPIIQGDAEMAQEQDDDEETIDPDDLFNIMISTDNHLGYKENDRIRSNDSFLAMEEVLAMYMNFH